MKPQTAQLSLQVAGRLSHFLHNWEVLTTDKWVLETVKGFQVPFVGHPVQEHRPNAPIYSTELNLLIQEEVKALLGKGAVQVCSPLPQESFYSTLFLVPKKGGQLRPVINLKKLNEWVAPQHFKMEGISTLRELLKANDWMVKIDLKDAYFTIPIHPAFSKVHDKSTTLPVHMPPIRPVLCSMGVHKSDETHINLPSKYGGTYDCLHRRHTSDGGVPSAGEGPPGGINLSADRPVHQNTEVDHNPSPTNRIFGTAGRLDHFTPKSTRRETSSHQVRNRPDGKEKLSNNCKAACPDYRETACSISGSPPSSPVLQVPSGRPAEGS